MHSERGVGVAEPLRDRRDRVLTGCVVRSELRSLNLPVRSLLAVVSSILTGGSAENRDNSRGWPVDAGLNARSMFAAEHPQALAANY